MASYITGDIFTYSPPKQTLKAWEPLWDCVSIFFLFQSSDIGDEYPEWKLYWVAGIALLRTVGHVLVKSDALASSHHKAEIDGMWKLWKANKSDNAIFWDFIETERNNLLKTYTFGATISQDDEGCYVKYSNGDDALELFREAIYWWRHQLIALEQRLPDNFS